MTLRQPIPKPIADTASDWLLRMEDGLSDADLVAFERWRKADPLHEDAFMRLQALWSELADAVPPSSVVVAFPRRSSRARRWGLGWAIAAGLALAWLGLGDDLLTRLRSDHLTGIGEHDRVVLADGSQIMFDSASAIAVDYGDRKRGIHLLKGRAMFTVKPDSKRPFVVEAGEAQVIALGTQFVIGVEDGHADAVVTEHSIRVRLAPGKSAVVEEGYGVRWDETGLHDVRSVDPGSGTAWTRGKLIVSGAPLRSVIAEIRRNRAGYIGLMGGADAIRVSGVYDLTRPDDALEAIRKTLNLREVRITDAIIVLRK